MSPEKHTHSEFLCYFPKHPTAGLDRSQASEFALCLDNIYHVTGLGLRANFYGVEALHVANKYSVLDKICI